MRGAISAALVALIAAPAVAGCGSSTPGAKDAKSACQQWQVHRASWVSMGGTSIGYWSDEQHLSTAIDDAMFAAQVNSRYTALSQDLQAMQAYVQGDPSAVDHDCASI